MKRRWAAKTLGEVCTVVNGGTPETGNPAFWGGEHRWITPAEMGKRLSPYVGDTERRISELGLRNSSAQLLPRNSVILSSRAPIGYLVINTEPMATNQGCKGLVPHRDLQHKFLYYYLSSIVELLDSLGTGATFRELSGGKLKEVGIPVPPLPDQERIVALLDRAFEGLAIAKANAEKSLQNAQGLFASHLRAVFSQDPVGGRQVSEEGVADATHILSDERQKALDDSEIARLNSGYVTRTGGRNATLRYIRGDLSLAVGRPPTPTRTGWRWSPLAELARLESGHTPSRKHSEYWGGSIPWIGIQDAKENHGKRIFDTLQKTNELGIANSSARVLPTNTVCLSRTASVGYVVVMGKPMATSQDFVNWVCAGQLEPDFLKYLILAEGREGLLRYASGSVHQTIYFPEAKAFHICHPDRGEQLRVVRQCDSLLGETQRLAQIYECKVSALKTLKKSILHQAFSGELHCLP